MEKQPFPTAGTGFGRRWPFRLRGGRERDAARRSELAARYEDLLDQVWRCEREWRLDDRIAYACRPRRR